MKIFLVFISICVTTTISNEHDSTPPLDYDFIIFDNSTSQNEHTFNLTSTPSYILESNRPEAARLRSKREPPFTIIKHRTRYIKRRPKPRRRTKSPKPAYGPPNYKYGEPLTFYKPTKVFSYTMSPPKPSYFEQPKYMKGGNGDGGGDFHSNLNIKKVPISDYAGPYSFDSGKEISYEKPVGFDLYDTSLKSVNNEESKPSYSYNEVTEAPNFSYNHNPPIESEVKTSLEVDPSVFLYNQQESSNGQYDTSQLPSGKPHEVYGVPPEGQSSSYYEPPKISYEQPAAPDTNYGPGMNFAEPPTDVHITYETEYEINPLPPSQTYDLPYDRKPKVNFRDYDNTGYQSQNSNGQTEFEYNYNSQQGNGGYFAEPPTGVKDITGTSNLPLEEDKRVNSYDYTKSSYEVPLYDLNPYESDSTRSNFYPPVVPDNYNVDNYNEDTTSAVAKGSSKVEVSLPKYSNHNNSSNESEKKRPKHPKGHGNSGNKMIGGEGFENKSVNQIHKPPSGTINESETTTTSTTTTLSPDENTTRQRRRRKKIRIPNAKRHILDSENLKNAFTHSHQKEDLHATETFFTIKKARPPMTTVAITTVSPKRKKPNNFVLRSAGNATPKESEGWLSWESSKIQNSEDTITPETEIAPERIKTRLKNKAKKTTKPNIEIISIQKSRSHSYYDGTIAPETERNVRNNVQKYPGITSRHDTQRAFEHSAGEVLDYNDSTSNEDEDSSWEPVLEDDDDDASNEPTSEESVLPSNHKYF